MACVSFLYFDIVVENMSCKNVGGRFHSFCETSPKLVHSILLIQLPVGVHQIDTESRPMKLVYVHLVSVFTRLENVNFGFYN